MNDKTGAESPQSVTVQFYYKGFSILLTKRDPEVEVKPLLENAMASIDWAITNNLQPSWNKQTNEEVLQPTQKTIHAEQALASGTTDWKNESVDGASKLCPIHNIAMKARTGQYGTFYSHWLGKDQSGKSLYCNGKVK